MTLTRWNPFREMDEFIDFFGRPVGSVAARRGEGSPEKDEGAVWAPSVDISETDDAFLLKVELPEVRGEDVDISIHEGVLTVQGERKMEREDSNRKYHRVERAYGKFVRSFNLPENVDEDGVSASHKDGVLQVRLGKTEKAKPRTIEIKAA